MNRTLLSLLVLLLFGWGTAWTQQERQASRAVTESHDPAAALNPERVTETRQQDGGRKIETRIVDVPSINGGYEPISETEQETIRVDSNTVRVVQHWFSLGAGNRQPFQVIEEERRTQPGGRESVVRTTSILDLSGHWQVQERDIEETVSTAPDTRETKGTVLGMVGGSLVPVQKSEEIEQHNGNLVEVQRKLLRPNDSGEFQVFEVQQSVATQTQNGRTTEEKIYRNDRRGQITPGIPSVWFDRAMYSTYVPGLTSDDYLHLIEQRSISTTATPEGGTRTEQKIRQVNPGNPEDGLRTTTIVTEVSQPLSKVETETHKRVRGLDGSGNFPTIYITDSRETKETH